MSKEAEDDEEYKVEKELWNRPVTSLVTFRPRPSISKLVHTGFNAQIGLLFIKITLCGKTPVTA